MDKDDAVDLLEALLNEDQQQATEILEKLDPSDREELNRLLTYKEDSAGALMNTEFVSIPEKLTVDALQRYRQAAPSESDAAFYLFIVNDYNQIKGVIGVENYCLLIKNAIGDEITTNQSQCRSIRKMSLISFKISVHCITGC